MNNKEYKELVNKYDTDGGFGPRTTKKFVEDFVNNNKKMDLNTVKFLNHVRVQTIEWFTQNNTDITSNSDKTEWKFQGVTFYKYTENNSKIEIYLKKHSDEEAIIITYDKKTKKSNYDELDNFFKADVLSNMFI